MLKILSLMQEWKTLNPIHRIDFLMALSILNTCLSVAGIIFIFSIFIKQAWMIFFSVIIIGYGLYQSIQFAKNIEYKKMEE